MNVDGLTRNKAWGLLVAIPCLLFVFWQGLGWLGATQPTAEPAPPTFIYGNPKARFTLVEYADLECPYCKDAYLQVKQLVDRHDQLNWQWQHLPLPMHGEAAQYEARLVTCAGWLGGNAVFWQAVESVYRHSRGNGVGLVIPFDQMGLLPQLPLAQLQLCAQSNATVRQVIADQAAAAALKQIDATPSFELRDNRSGRTIGIAALLDDAGMLSAMDWLASQGGTDAQQRR